MTLDTRYEIREAGESVQAWVLSHPTFVRLTIDARPLDAAEQDRITKTLRGLVERY